MTQFDRNAARLATANEQLFYRIKHDQAISVPSGSEVGTEYGWPRWASELLWKPHKFRDERFALFCFLYQNGCPPNLCNLYILWHKDFGWEYDLSAIRDQAGLAASALKGSGKTYEAIINKKVKHLG